MEKKATCEKAIMQAGLEKSKWENLILSSQNELTRLLRIEEDYNKNKDLIENKESNISNLKFETSQHPHPFHLEMTNQSLGPILLFSILLHVRNELYQQVMRLTFEGCFLLVCA